LVIAGAHDPLHRLRTALLADQIPVCRYAELNAAHLSNIEIKTGSTEK